MRNALASAWGWAWGSLAGVFIILAVLCMCAAAGIRTGCLFCDRIVDAIPD